MKRDYLKNLDRTVVSVTVLGEEDPLEETRYWRSKSPAERLMALEILRMRMGNYDNTQSRLQRVYRITKLK